MYWVKTAQADAFKTELADYGKGKGVNTKSDLLQLPLFIDAEGALRVEGRIDRAANLLYGARHQLVLPQRYYVTSPII